MRRNGWHMVVEGDVLTLARRMPARFDVSATTRLPDARRGRVAHQVRQDLWRALRDVRGFSPVVRVVREAAGLRVEAGGRVEGAAAPAALEARIADMLSCEACRARWVRCAR